MEGRVIALMVAINDYLPPVSALHGCRNDIAEVEAALRMRLGERLVTKTLCDADATRENVTNAFREHLGGAGPDDTALFVYAGHGSEEPAPPEHAKSESTNRWQTLMLYDSGRRINGKLRRPLADKELAVLLREVAQRAGHVAVILDCCSSGGATRDPFARPRGWTPSPVGDPDLDGDVVALAAPRSVEDCLPGTLEAVAEAGPSHVALSACASWEKAKEFTSGDTVRGAFSMAFVESLDALGEHATYRSLMATAASRVARLAEDQHPELFPVDRNGPADRLFLGGVLPPVQSSFSVTRQRAGWSVNAGVVHGMCPPVGEEAFVLACTDPDGSFAGMAKVIDVSTASSTVEPVGGWTPRDVAYRAVVADVPLPAAEVSLDEPLPLIVDAITGAGPHGGPSPHLRVASDGGVDAAVKLRVQVPRTGAVQIARPDGSALTGEFDLDGPSDAHVVVRNLEHIARWEMIRGLGRHPSPLSDAVVLDVYDAEDGETALPPGRAPRLPSAVQRLEYQRRSDGFLAPPRVFMELRNTTDRELYVAVLDLTDQFACRPIPSGEPTIKLVAGHTRWLFDGKAVPLMLPPSRPVRPGAKTHDWLKIIVSDVDFDNTAFELPSLGEPEPTRMRSTSAPRGTLDRLAAKAVTRMIGEPPAEAADWAATTVELLTEVPPDTPG